MKRGRKPKNEKMGDAKEHVLKNASQSLPQAEEGDSIKISLEITRVSNGYIVKNIEPDTKAGIMVFNGQDAHRMISSHVFSLAMADMKEGEVINFSSQLQYIKKQKNGND